MSDVNYQKFIEFLEKLHRMGFNDKEIAGNINVTPAHFSKIKHKNVTATEKVLSLMEKLINDNKLINNKNQETFSLNEPMMSHKTRSELEKLNYNPEEEIIKLKKEHQKEIDQLNSVIDHLKFIIEEYKKLNK